MCDANLESAIFDNCDMNGLDLSGGTLNDTRFNRCRATIHAAAFGTLSGLVSVVIDKRQLLTRRASSVNCSGGRANGPGRASTRASTRRSCAGSSTPFSSQTAAYGGRRCVERIS